MNLERGPNSAPNNLPKNIPFHIKKKKIILQANHILPLHFAGSTATCLLIEEQWAFGEAAP